MNDQSRRTDTFLRGLLTGVVVGAVIAGSTLWERRRRGAAAADGVPEAVPPSAPDSAPDPGRGGDWKDPGPARQAGRPRP